MASIVIPAVVTRRMEDGSEPTNQEVTIISDLTAEGRAMYELLQALGAEPDENEAITLPEIREDLRPVYADGQSHSTRAAEQAFEEQMRIAREKGL